jgi:hypothetical protein
VTVRAIGGEGLAKAGELVGWALILGIMAMAFGFCGCASVDKVNAAVVSGMAAASAAEPFLLAGYQAAQEACLRGPKEEIDACLGATREDFAIVIDAYSKAEAAACALAPDACSEPAK